jgi:hypothetical protein
MATRLLVTEKQEFDPPLSTTYQCSSMVEQLPVKEKVAGSSPAVGAIYGVRLIGRTPGFEPGNLGSNPDSVPKKVLDKIKRLCLTYN